MEVETLDAPDAKKARVDESSSADAGVVEVPSEMNGGNGIKDDEMIARSSLINEFICPGCKSYFRNPIQLCQEGHSICGLCCQPQNVPNTCPSEEKCKGFVQNPVKCVSLMRLAKILNLAVPCKYRDNGCKATEIEGSIQLHEEGCTFRSIVCPLYGCKSTVVVELIDSHLQKAHAELMEKEGQWNMFGTGGVGETYRFAAKTWVQFGKRFFAFIENKKQDQPWRPWVAVVADSEAASNFKIELNMSSPDGGFSVQFTDTAKTVDISREKMSSRNVFCIPDLMFREYNGGKQWLSKKLVDKVGNIVVPIDVQVFEKPL